MNRRHFVSLLPAAAAFAQNRPQPAKQAAAPVRPDWPQWHGPNRDNLSTETGLLKQWPAGGPKLLWQTKDLGSGYGSLAIAGDQIYVQGVKDGSSVVWALNRADGKILSHAALGPSLDQDRGGGPRGTPVVEADVVYALTENGDLGAFQRRTGQSVWKRNILADFSGSNTKWLISESPLVDGNKLIVSPGGSKGIMVALDKKTGKDIWACRDANIQAGYSSVIAADVGGVRVYTTMMDESSIGVRASDGKLMWQYDRASNGTANVTTPVFHDNKVFYTSAYGTGCGLLGLTVSGQDVKAQEIYFNREMQNHHGGVVLHNSNLYGYSASILTCMDFASGKSYWKDRSVGKGSVTFADGQLYLLGENQTVGLADATPDGYREKGRFSIEDQGKPSWAHPVVCGGKLYVRNQGLLNCYDIKA